MIASAAQLFNILDRIDDVDKSATEHDFEAIYSLPDGRNWVGTTHRGGKSVSTKLYTVWINLRKRCKGQYKSRGITCCEEWSDFGVFRSWALTNGYRVGLSIDRINNDGNYEPSNCRWATAKQQARNRSNNVVNEDIVREIRLSNEPPKFFKKKYGLDQRYVWEIRTHKVWRDV